MIIENVKVYIKGKIVEKSIKISGEKISEIGSFSSTEKKINGKGTLVLPGLIDPHVHLRDPGATQKEDFFTGTRAALAGGFTTVLDMPNNPEPTVTLERLKEKKELVREKGNCDVGFHFGATEDNFEEIKRVNPDSLKLIMGQTTGSLLINKEEIIREHFENFDKKKPIVIHAEDQNYIRQTGDDSPKAAWLAVRKVARVAKETNRRIHIAHVGTKKEVDLAKNWGKSTVEVAPHYLFLSKKNFAQLGDLRFVKPPLREERYRVELWDHLDKVDCVGSDHAPHLIEEKKKGAFGFPGLETSFHLFLDSYLKGRISLQWIVERMAENPAKIFGIKRKGEIKKGNFADLTFVDLKKEWTVKGEEMETKCKWSPYENWKLKGKVKGTMNKGELKYWDGEFLV